MTVQIFDFLYSRSRLPPLDSLHIHILLFIWAYGPRHAPVLHRGVLATLTTYFIAPGGMDWVITDVINSTDATKILPDDLVSRLISSLQSPQELNENLRAYTMLINRLIVYSGTLQRVRSDSARGPGLAESLCIACQRQLCSGDIAFDDSILETFVRDLA